MADIDYKKLAKNTEDDWQGLFQRMKDDRDLVNLIPYILLDASKEQSPIPNALSVTLNDIPVFATNVEAALAAASEQVVVTSEDKGFKTENVEAIIRAGFRAINKALSRQKKLPLNYFTDQQNCRKGRCAARVIFDINPKTNELIPKLRYWDPLNLTYGLDEEGLWWTSYKTRRSRDVILAEYPDVNLKDTDTDIEVQDIWTREHNEVWIDNTEVIRREHKLKSHFSGDGYVPVILEIVPVGSFGGEIEFEGESLFYMIRDLVPEVNRLASLFQSLNQKQLDHALQFKTDSDEYPLEETPDHDEVTSPRAVTQVPKGGGFELMPLGAFREQALWLNQMLEVRIQRGGLSNFDAGTFSQPMSGRALIQVAEGRDQVFMPRLGTRGLFNTGVAEMMIDQIRSSGASQVIIAGQTYKVSDLEGEYDIRFDYTVKSPGRDIAKHQMAASVEPGLISQRTKRVTILEVEDNTGEERQLLIEMAARVFPTTLQYDIVRALVEEGELGDEDAELKAEMAAKEMGLTLKQILVGGLQPVLPTPTKSSPDDVLRDVLDTTSARQPQDLLSDGGVENATL